MCFFLLFVNKATEVHRDDLELQQDISCTQSEMEKYPALYEAFLNGMPKQIEAAEKDLAKQKSEKEQTDRKPCQRTFDQNVKLLWIEQCTPIIIIFIKSK